MGKWVRNSSGKEIFYFLVLWIIVTLLSQTSLAEFKYFSQITYYFSGSIGYVVLGYYLTKYPIFSKSNKTIVILLFLLVISVLFTVFGTYYLSNASGKSIQTFYSYYTINVIVETLSVFLLFSIFAIRNALINRTLGLISKYSYGIFLSHVLVLTALSFLKIDCLFIHPLIGIIVTVILCLSVSGVMVGLVNKLPYGKFISG